LRAAEEPMEAFDFSLAVNQSLQGQKQADFFLKM